MIYCWLIITKIAITKTKTIRITQIIVHARKEQTHTTTSTINRNILTITHMRSYQDIHIIHLTMMILSTGTITTHFGRITIERI